MEFLFYLNGVEAKLSLIILSHPMLSKRCIYLKIYILELTNMPVWTVILVNGLSFLLVDFHLKRTLDEIIYF